MALSAWLTPMRRRPHPRSWFAAMIPRIISLRFEQTVLKGQIGDAFLQRASFAA